jgi:hypothetical protein
MFSISWEPSAVGEQLTWKSTICRPHQHQSLAKGPEGSWDTVTVSDHLIECRDNPVFAPIRFAMNRSRSGSIVRSSVDTAYQLGFDR